MRWAAISFHLRPSEEGFPQVRALCTAWSCPEARSCCSRGPGHRRSQCGPGLCLRPPCSYTAALRDAGPFCPFSDTGQKARGELRGTRGVRMVQPVGVTFCDPVAGSGSRARFSASEPRATGAQVLPRPARSFLGGRRGLWGAGATFAASGLQALCTPEVCLGAGI